MSGSLDRTFGLMIAFLLPGFVVVLGVAFVSPAVANWLSQEPAPSAGLGGFVYVVMSSLAAGMMASAIRWLTIDTLLHGLGLRPPELDFSKLQANLDAFELAVHHNYRHYQFYANSFVSLWVFAACHQLALSSWWLPAWVGFGALEAVLLVTARDCLQRYNDRISEIIGEGE
jgi:hypothetical protein